MVGANPVEQSDAILTQAYNRLLCLLRNDMWLYIYITNDHRYILNHNRIISTFITYHLVHNKSYTTDVVSGAETAYPSGTPELNPRF